MLRWRLHDRTVGRPLSGVRRWDTIVEERVAGIKGSFGAVPPLLSTRVLRGLGLRVLLRVPELDAFSSGESCTPRLSGRPGLVNPTLLLMRCGTCPAAEVVLVTGDESCPRSAPGRPAVAALFRSSPIEPPRSRDARARAAESASSTGADANDPELARPRIVAQVGSRRRLPGLPGHALPHSLSGT